MASPEDMAFFRQQQQSDIENRQCFECKAPNPQWCDVWHGIYVCLECSGVHRSLGTHVSFVRSLSMDTWPADKMALMKVGGNPKARAFFRSKGIDDLPIREKYATDFAIMYKDKLSAEANGKVFRESEWKAPEKKAYVSQAQNTARPEPGFGGSRYEGIGAPSNKQNNNDGWKALSSGLASIGSVVTEAASVAAVKSRELASTAAESASNIKLDKMKPKAADGWGLGGLASWAKSIAGPAEPNDDPFAAALANLEKKGTYSSISSNNISPVPSSSPLTPDPPRVSPSRTPPLSPDVNPKKSPVSQSSNNDWEWNEDEDDKNPVSPVTPGSATTSSLGSSKRKGLGAKPVGKSSGVPLSSLKKTSVGKKAE